MNLEIIYLRYSFLATGSSLFLAFLDTLKLNMNS